MQDKGGSVRAAEARRTDDPGLPQKIAARDGLEGHLRAGDARPSPRVGRPQEALQRKIPREPRGPSSADTQDQLGDFSVMAAAGPGSGKREPLTDSLTKVLVPCQI